MRLNEDQLVSIVKTNPKIDTLINEVDLDYEWYIGGGSICQTYWNYKTNRDLNYGINDFDIVYFDNDLSEEKEQLISNKLSNYFKKKDIKVEVVNQCRAHLWYPKYFGNSIRPITNINLLGKIPNYTCVCFWISNKLNVFAPFGVEDIFKLNIRYSGNTAIPTKFIKPKIDKWINIWPELNVINDSFPKEVFD